MNTDDPKFTAHALGELADLTPAERAEIEALLASDPTAAAEAAETQALAARLRAELPGEAAAALQEGQRAAVLKAVGSTDVTAKVVRFPRRANVLAAVAACAVVGITATLIVQSLQTRNHTPPRSTVVAEKMPDISLLVADGSVTDPDSKPSLPILATPAPASPAVPVGEISLAQKEYAVGSGVPAAPVAMPFEPQTATLKTSTETGPSTLTLAGTNSYTGTPTVTAGGRLSVSSSLDAAAERQLREAEAFSDTGRFVLAEKRYKQVLQKDPNNIDAAEGLKKTKDAMLQYGVAAHNETRADVISKTEMHWARPIDQFHQRESEARTNRQGGAFEYAAPGSSSFDAIAENVFLPVRETPLSTFSIDVDTASYAIVRRMLNDNQRPPDGAVRIEELLNYFSYDYPQPKGDVPFSATMEVAACPWAPEHRLVRIGLKGREIPKDQRPPSNPRLPDRCLRLDEYADQAPALEAEPRAAHRAAPRAGSGGDRRLCRQQRLRARVHPRQVGHARGHRPPRGRGLDQWSQRHPARLSDRGKELHQGRHESGDPRHRRRLERGHHQPEQPARYDRPEGEERRLPHRARLRHGQSQRLDAGEAGRSRQWQLRLYRHADRGEESLRRATEQHAGDHRQGR